MAAVNIRAGVAQLVLGRIGSGIELVVLDSNAVTRQQGLTQVWSLSGTWRGLVGNEKMREIFASNGRTTALIDATGKVVREFSGTAPTLRRARLNASGDYALLLFGTFSANVTAYSPVDMYCGVTRAPGKPRRGSTTSGLWI